MKYRKKPVEAFRVGVDDLPEWFCRAIETGGVEVIPPYDLANESVGDRLHYKIKTPNGWLDADPGHFVVKDDFGRIYPCRYSTFKATYEEIEA